LDLSILDHAEKIHLIEAALRRIRELRRLNAAPHWVILDEALHAGGVSEHAGELEGRGFCLVTCRLSWIRASLLDQIDLVLFTRTTAPTELEFVRSGFGAAGLEHDLASVLPNLWQGQGVRLGLSATANLGALTFALAPRQTAHVRHLRKYVDNHLPPHHCFLFRSPEGGLVATADSLSAFRHAVAVIPADSLGFHAGREDFSRWVHDVFRDRALARQLRKVEARWKRGEIHNLREALARPLAVAMGGLV
jgi:hypothetical protein